MKGTADSDYRYLAIREDDFKWGITVTTAGFQSIGPHCEYPPAGHPERYDFSYARGRILEEYQIVYITEGSGLFESGKNQQTAITAGTFFLLTPGEWHRYRPDQNSGWDAFWVGFSGEIADNLVTSGYFSGKDPVINIGLAEEAVDLYLRIIEACKEERPGFQQFISGMVMHLMGYIYYRQKDKDFAENMAIRSMNKARLIIRERIDQKQEPEKIAAELNMSYSWFRRLFRQYTGISPQKYIAGLRIQRAKELLSGTSRSVKEIADAMSFENMDYFSSWFRKLSGMTPTQYRNMVHGRSIPRTSPETRKSNNNSKT
jgi:AraC-like DNA-binding protein